MLLLTWQKCCCSRCVSEHQGCVRSSTECAAAQAAVSIYSELSEWRPQVRKNGSVPWLRPDGKTQVTIEYKKDGGAMIPIRVHTILISTQHSPDVTNDKIHADLMEYVIKPVVPSKYLDDSTIFHLNPSGAPLCLPSGCSLARLLAFMAGCLRLSRVS